MFLSAPRHVAWTGAGVGLGDPELARCVAGVVRAIEFPRPKNCRAVDAAISLTFQPKPAP